MQILQHTFGRPAAGLAMVIALTALLAALACGSAAEPEPTHAPTAAAETSPSHTESQPQDAATRADAVVVINMAITERASSLSREDLQVKKGDTVNIKFTADEEGEIHLHGYDLTAPVSPDSPGTLSFVAETAGAFGINFHVFGDAGAGGGATGGNNHHGTGVPAQVVSETPISLAITAEADADGGINVHIDTEGFRFAPELVDQSHTPGSGHAHIYMDGVKLGRVFESDYRITDVPPGEREIRVSLNTNDHSELVFDGKKLEATAAVTVPDVGQGQGGHDHSSHSHSAPGNPAVIAEVHLGNLEVYP